MMDDATGDSHYVTHQFDNSAAICRCIWICYQCMLYNDIHLDRECLCHAIKRSGLPSNLSHVSHIRRYYNCWSLRCSWSIACRWCSNYIFIFDLTPHDDVIKWKHFPRNWPFVREIRRSPVNSPHKGEWRGALMLSVICVWINGWVNNRGAGDLRRYRAHYDVIVMWLQSIRQR